jgi:hypothetical protein
MFSRLGRDSALNKGLHDSPRSKCFRSGNLGKGSFTTQVENVAYLLGFWSRLRSARSLPSQAVDLIRLGCARIAAALIVSLALLGSSPSAFAAEISDITLRTGAQLKDRIGQAYANPNFKAAAEYFGERGLSIGYDDLVEVKFRADRRPDVYDLVLVPFSQPKESAGEKLSQDRAA